MTGFFTELFARPRPGDAQRACAAQIVHGALRSEAPISRDVRPADFPRIGRR